MKSVAIVRTLNALLHCQARTQITFGRLHFLMWCCFVSDLKLPSVLSEVCACDFQCYDPVEKLYYSMDYDQICVYCCAEQNLVTKGGYYILSVSLVRIKFQ